MEDANRSKKIHNLFNNLHHLNQKDAEEVVTKKKQSENDEKKKEIRLSRSDIIKGLRMGKSFALQTELRNQLKQSRENRRYNSVQNKTQNAKLDFSKSPKNREDVLKNCKRELRKNKRKFVEKIFKENGVTPYTMALLKKVRSADDYQNIPDRPRRICSRQRQRS